MSLERDLKSIVEQEAENAGLFLVECLSRPVNAFIFNVDADQGLDINTLAQVSRAVSRRVDVEILTEDRFLYEISSPGADRPLKLLRQYHKHIGRKLDLKMLDGSKHTGVLTDIKDNLLTILPDPKTKKEVPEPMVVDFNEVKEAQIIISFK